MSTPTNSADASCGELSCDECNDRYAALTAERDQLRAELEKVYSLVTPVGFDLPGGIFQTAQAVTELATEVERLNALGSWAHTCIHHTDEERKAWVACPCCAIARAERAEAALADAQPKSDHYMSAWLERAAARAERAEAELATERARLDSGQIMLRVAGERVWHSGVDLRAAIDAAMKEGSK